MKQNQDASVVVTCICHNRVRIRGQVLKVCWKCGRTVYYKMRTHNTAAGKVIDRDYTTKTTQAEVESTD